MEKSHKTLQRIERLQRLNSAKEWINDDLYRLMYKEDLYIAAYERIKSQPGNMTPGTDGIATRGGRSSGLMTPRRPPNLDPKGRGDKSMVGKRGAAEDVCAVVLQRLSDKAKTGLFASQSPGVEPHTRR